MLARVALLVGLVVGLLAGPVSAQVVTVAGVIDFDRIAPVVDAVRAVPDRGRLTVRLASPGGSVAAANRLADVLAAAEMRGVTVTTVAAECDSACVLLWVAGTRRLVLPGGWLGVHACARAGAIDAACSAAVRERVAAVVPGLAAAADQRNAWASHAIVRFGANMVIANRWGGAA